MFRATPGQLPTDGTPTLAGVTLPPGCRIRSESADSPDDIGWVTTELLAEAELTRLVRTLAAAFEHTGLWPLQVTGLNPTNIERPWLDGELLGPDDRTIDAESLFDGSWYAARHPDRFLDLDDDEIASPAPFHAMADAIDGPDLAADELVIIEPAALLLVPVDRPANVPKALGWLGATNHSYVGEPVSAVLRSWEDRFGATLVKMSFDTLALQVPRAPQSGEQVERVVAEHYAFCPDNIDQGMEAEDYAEFLPDWEAWSFWWD